MNIKYFIKDKITFIQFKINSTSKEFKEVKEKVIGFLNINNLYLILLLLIIFYLIQILIKRYSINSSWFVIILGLIIIIKYYYNEWKKKEYVFWERERKGYKINKKDLKEN